MRRGSATSTCESIGAEERSTPQNDGALRVAAVVPMFNHRATVVEVVESLRHAGLPVIVVDDGSRDDGAATVADWIAATGADGELVRLPENRGKAAALLAGFAAARRRGASHVLTMDADGQHDASRIPAFLEELASSGSPHALVLGERRPIPPSYPLARLCGRMLSNTAVRAASGAVVGDSACGMRIYPLALTDQVRCIGGRYAWEEEIIVRLVWAGAALRHVTIPVIYRASADAPSHYRFGRDWSEGTVVLVSLILQRIFAFWTWRSRARHRREPMASDLWWPIVSRSAGSEPLAGMLTIFVIALTAMMWGAARLLELTSFGLVALSVALAWALWRTRTPLLAAVAGVAAATAAPLAAMVGAIPGAAIAIVMLVNRRRKR